MLKRFLLLLTIVSLSIVASSCGKWISYNGADSNSPYAAQWLADYEVRSSDPKIVALAKQLTDGISDPETKVTAIHNWVAMHIQYDYSLEGRMEPDQVATQIIDAYDLNVATTVLQEGKAICEGFASLTASLLVAAGIPAKIVTGSVTSSSEHCNHAWNKALVDGSWIVLDTTWDAGGTGYSCESTYLNPDPAFFAQTHTECNESSGS